MRESPGCNRAVESAWSGTKPCLGRVKAVILPSEVRVVDSSLQHAFLFLAGAILFDSKHFCIYNYKSCLLNLDWRARMRENKICGVWAAVSIYIGILVFAAIVLFLTGSVWSLLILLLLFGVSYRDTIKVSCPKCQCEFIVGGDTVSRALYDSRGVLIKEL